MIVKEHIQRLHELSEECVYLNPDTRREHIEDLEEEIFSCCEQFIDYYRKFIVLRRQQERCRRAMGG